MHWDGRTFARAAPAADRWGGASLAATAASPGARTGSPACRRVRGFARLAHPVLERGARPDRQVVRDGGAMPRLISDRPILSTSSELNRVMATARAREQAGERVLHLERGEPDFDTPPHIV